MSACHQHSYRCVCSVWQERWPGFQQLLDWRLDGMPVIFHHRLLQSPPCLLWWLRLSGWLQIHLFSENAASHSFSVDKEFLKQSKIVSAADCQCYLLATGFEISFIPKGGHYFHWLPWWRCSIAAVCSTGSRCSHSTWLNQTICFTWHRFSGKRTPGCVKLS